MSACPASSLTGGVTVAATCRGFSRFSWGSYRFWRRDLARGARVQRALVLQRALERDGLPAASASHRDGLTRTWRGGGGLGGASDQVARASHSRARQRAETLRIRAIASRSRLLGRTPVARRSVDNLAFGACRTAARAHSPSARHRAWRSASTWPRLSPICHGRLLPRHRASKSLRPARGACANPEPRAKWRRIGRPSRTRLVSNQPGRCQTDARPRTDACTSAPLSSSRSSTSASTRSSRTTRRTSRAAAPSSAPTVLCPWAPSSCSRSASRISRSRYGCAAR